MEFPGNNLRLQNIHERSGQSMVDPASIKEDDRSVSFPKTINSSIKDQSLRGTAQGVGAFPKQGMVSGVVNMNQTFQGDHIK